MELKKDLVWYQGYGKKIDKDLIKKCNLFVSNYLDPKITIIMDLDYEKSLLRMGSNKDRMEENSKIFFKDVIIGYRELASKNPNRYFIIDGNLNKNEIHKLIWNKIKMKCQL